MTARNWFDRGGDAYARHRPDYPPALAALLADLAPDQGLAVDIGCGSGQFTCQLAAHFTAVIGIDSSAAQIEAAMPHARVRYVCASASDTGVSDASAGLVCAAQAAHWFDLPAFYAEARRIARSGAIVALISYGVPVLEPDLQDRFDQFYWNQIAPYWPDERRLVESGYADIAFPFAEFPVPPLAIERNWAFGDFAGYVSTWSAVRRASDDSRGDIASSFLKEMEALWGEGRHHVAWPINGRFGRMYLSTKHG